MAFSQEVKRLLALLLGMFCLIFLVAAYWAVSGSETILQREDNGRLFEEEAGVIRGELFDRNGVLLAASVRNPNRIVTRDYKYPAFDGTLGYYSLLYGVDGVESTYDSDLRNEDVSDDWHAFFREDLLHLPRQGTDLLLTYDLAVQQVLAELMEDRVGAAVLMSVPEGEMIAMVSRPAYDPNTLDEDWDQLLSDTHNPLLNRAILGEYQPGTLFHIPLMTLAFADGFDTAMVFPLATQSVDFEGLTLRCTMTPSNVSLSLRDAYIYGCPYPFRELINTVSVERAIAGSLRFFGSAGSIVLEGYVQEKTNQTDADVSVISDEGRLAEAFGQGDLTITPLAVAGVSAAIINGGNAPQPFSVLATRDSPNFEWQMYEPIRSTFPITTAGNAARLQSLMVDAVAYGMAGAAQRPGLNIGGHSAIAFAGDERALVWFTGFVTIEGHGGFAIAVLLENAGTTEDAAEIGGIVLEAAVNSLQATRDGL